MIAQRNERRRLAIALIGAAVLVGIPAMFANETTSPSAFAVALIVLFFAVPFTVGLALLVHSSR